MLLSWPVWSLLSAEMAPPMERWAATATSAGQTGCSHGQTGSSSPPTVGGAPFSVYVPLAAGSNSGSLESLTSAPPCISYYKQNKLNRLVHDDSRQLEWHIILNFVAYTTFSPGAIQGSCPILFCWFCPQISSSGWLPLTLQVEISSTVLHWVLSIEYQRQWVLSTDFWILSAEYC